LDFDKLRKGHVTKNQFSSILSQLNFNFTQDEYNSLGKKYETNDPEKFFNYVAFVESINKAFTTKGIDKVPTARVAAVTQNDTLLARRKYLQTSVNCNEEELSAVLDEYRRAVGIRRMHLKPVFQDFDRTKNGHVTKLQFLRVLDLLKINAPEHVTQEILRRYMDKGNVDEVNYVDFCEDVDGATQLYGVGQEHNHSFDYYPKTRPRVSKAEIVRNTPEDVEDVCARIRTVCSQRRIRISEFFRDFDKLRTGHITNAQFRIGLNLGKVQISQGEFKLLTEYFKAPKEGEHICWKSFSDHIDEVFTKKELEKSVDISLTDTRVATNYNRRMPTAEEC
jgi:Ca2+-binding EF-hand superfamily protein